MICTFGEEGYTIRPVEKDDIASVLRVYQESEDFLSLGPVPVASMDMVMADIESSRRSGGVYCGVWNGTVTYRMSKNI
jgi:uncharacterized cupin superfamily protein